MAKNEIKVGGYVKPKTSNHRYLVKYILEDKVIVFNAGKFETYHKDEVEAAKPHFGVFIFKHKHR